MKNITSFLLIVFLLIFINSTKDIQQQIITTFDNDGNKINIILEKQKTLLADGALNLEYFPDVSTTLLSRNPYRILFAAGTKSYLLEGKDIEHLTKSKLILSPGEKGSYDNGYAGICGIYFHKDKKIYAFYHAEDHENMGFLSGGANIPGFYARIALAVSNDNGVNWEKLGVILESSKPKDWSFYNGQQDKGVGEQGVVLDKSGKYLYMYYSEHSRHDGRGVQICMARAEIDNNPPLAGTWKKYYNGSFSQDGLKGLDTPVISAKAMDDAEAVFPHPVFSKTLNKYIMIYNINFWKEYVDNKGLKNSGIYLSYSDDGINWTKPYLLIKDWAMPLPGKSISWEANIIWDENSDTEGYLVYAYSNNWGHRSNNMTPHYMVARRISFKKM